MKSSKLVFFIYYIFSTLCEARNRKRHSGRHVFKRNTVKTNYSSFDFANFLIIKSPKDTSWVDFDTAIYLEPTFFKDNAFVKYSKLANENIFEMRQSELKLNEEFEISLGRRQRFTPKPQVKIVCDDTPLDKEIDIIISSLRDELIKNAKIRQEFKEIMEKYDETEIKSILDSFFVNYEDVFKVFDDLEEKVKTKTSPNVVYTGNRCKIFVRIVKKNQKILKEAITENYLFYISSNENLKVKKEILSSIKIYTSIVKNILGLCKLLEDIAVDMNFKRYSFVKS